MEETKINKDFNNKIKTINLYKIITGTGKKTKILTRNRNTLIIQHKTIAIIKSNSEILLFHNRNNLKTNFTIDSFALFYNIFNFFKFYFEKIINFY